MCVPVLGCSRKFVFSGRVLPVVASAEHLDYVLHAGLDDSDTAAGQCEDPNSVSYATLQGHLLMRSMMLVNAKPTSRSGGGGGLEIESTVSTTHGRNHNSERSPSAQQSGVKVHRLSPKWCNCPDNYCPNSPKLHLQTSLTPTHPCSRPTVVESN